MSVRRSVGVVVVLIAAIAPAACGGDALPEIDPGDGGDYTVTLDPADFVGAIDNPLLPFVPGSRWVYEGESDGEIERIEIVVTNDTRQILGITATVVRDTVTVDGELVEDTFDWYAQDRDGNVWYLGEDSTEYEGGEPVSTAGSWEAGMDGALPGIIMEVAPAVGDAYRQEFAAGEAEDMAEVVRTGENVSVTYGSFEDVMVTKEWTPLEPHVVEEKYYAPGIGVVLEVQTIGGSGRTELVTFEPGA